MKEIIDLYTKILLGTFTFIGPSFSLLIPLFYSAFLNAQTKYEEQKKNLHKILLSMKEEGGSIPTVIADEVYKKLLRNNHHFLNLLKPVRQLTRIFSGLFLSLFFIALYHFANWACLPLAFLLCPVLLSLIFFVYCMRVLWQLFNVVIKTKTEEELEKRQVRLTQ